MSRVVGMDPGAKGAIALIDTETLTLAVIDIPVEIATKGRSATSPNGVARALQAAAPDAVFIEHVTASPQMGVTSAFAFGRGYGILLGASCGTGSVLWPVRPQEWKTKLKVPADKKQAVARADQLFPAAFDLFHGPRGGVLDGRAEACLLALYGVMTLAQLPPRPLLLVDFPQFVSE